jgi:hypothetical protein
VLLGIGPDRQPHVSCVLLGLGASRARVLGELLPQPLGLRCRQALELECLAPSLRPDLLGCLLGGLEDSGDPLADCGVPGVVGCVRVRGLVAAALVQQEGRT